MGGRATCRPAISRLVVTDCYAPCLAVTAPNSSLFGAPNLDALCRYRSSPVRILLYPPTQDLSPFGASLQFKPSWYMSVRLQTSPFRPVGQQCTSILIASGPGPACTYRPLGQHSTSVHHSLHQYRPPCVTTLPTYPRQFPSPYRARFMSGRSSSSPHASTRLFTESITLEGNSEPSSVS